jgi:hypothetical protein
MTVITSIDNENVLSAELETIGERKPTTKKQQQTRIYMYSQLR